MFVSRRLIIATGVAKPVIPDIPGVEYTEGYETMSLNRSDFEGLTVLILGKFSIRILIVNTVTLNILLIINPT